MCLTDFRKQARAVPVWQSPVEYYGVVRLALYMLSCFSKRPDHIHGVVFPRKEHTEILGNNGVIFDEEYPHVTLLYPVLLHSSHFR